MRGKALSTFASAVGLAVVASAADAQQAVSLPNPTGPYQFGTTYFAVVDATRPEVFTEDPNDHRALLVRAWYPRSQ